MEPPRVFVTDGGNFALLYDLLIGDFFAILNE
jgi:hypothetical protein